MLRPVLVVMMHLQDECDPGKNATVLARLMSATLLVLIWPVLTTFCLGKKRFLGNQQADALMEAHFVWCCSELVGHWHDFWKVD